MSYAYEQIFVVPGCGAALALAVAVPAWAAGAANGSARSWVATATHAHRLSANTTVHGAAPMNMPVHVAVVLKARNSAQLNSLAAAMHRPGAPSPLSTKDVVANFAPSDTQVQAVVGYLRSAGFDNIHVAANRMMVTADGDAVAAESTFHTSLVAVTTAHGRNTYANTHAAFVPQALGGTVLSVIGLQNVNRAHTMLKGPGAHPDGNGHGGGHGGGGGGSTTGVITGHNPTEFPTIYNVGSTPDASSITVGIISAGDMSQTLSDLNQFTSANGLSTVSTQVVYPGAQGTDTSGTAEWDLDSQDIVAMSGGVSKLIFYAATSLSNSDLTTAFNKAVSDNQAQVVNVSLGECETYAYQDGSMAADDQILALGVVQGQTFSISTGDSGSNECSKSPRGTTPSYPASSPNVIAVSGTTLSTTTSGAWAGETLWADAGGSPSTVEAKPSWQTQGDSMRDVADVAFDADPNSGAIIIVNGGRAQYGGTSLAAPLFAATWARMLAAHPGAGFAGPHLYTASTSNYHDVTSGSNGGESATAGWDFASGFGSVIVSSLNANM